MRHKTTTALMFLFAGLGLITVAGTTHAAILDFSSGTFLDRPPGAGLDYYAQDGYIVEIADPGHNTSMGTCPGRWCFDNLWGVPAETTFLTSADGSAFDLTSLQVFQSAQGLNFTADGGAFLNSTDLGTIFFGPEFQDITLLRIDIPCRGPGASCRVTLDNIDVNPVPIPAAVWLFGSGLLGLIGLSRKRRVIPS
ncbi:MAG: hypothetical protein AB2792_08390 [Candidatus Thiodiazotropha sp.]